MMGESVSAHDEKQHGQRHGRRWPFAAAAVLMAGGLWWLKPQAAEKPEHAAADPVQVTTGAVTAQDVPNYRSGIGTVAATQSVTVKARVDGQLERVGFTEGQDVKAGQLIARLDPRPLQATLAQTQATQAKDAAQLANARVDLARYTKLIADDAATQQQVDTQKALVAQLEAAVQTDAAAVSSARVQLDYATITAPIGGRTGARLVDPGNIVHAADTTGIVVINQVDPISVVFTLPEDAFQDVNRAINEAHAAGRPLAVEAYPRAGTELLGAGRLVLLNNTIDAATGTVPLKGSIPNPEHKLWPGQYVNVRLVLGDHAQALTVPAAAVQRSQSGTYVYAVDAGGKQVQMKPVQVAQIQDGVARIQGGLAAGERVVVDGQYKLKPGSDVVESAPRGAKAANAASAVGQ